MKSIKKELTGPLRSTLLIILLTLAAGFPPAAQSPADILDFYWKRTGETFSRVDPGRAGLSYRLSTNNLYLKLSRGGVENATDSALIDYYFTGTTLDSQVVRRGNGKRFAPVQLTIPDIFAYPYHLSTFPNDNGRGPLAIGIDTDSADITQPTGLMMVDRNSYDLTELLLYYDTYEDYVRFTRSFGFVSRDGYVIPDTSWIVASRPGILSPEHFRIETDITAFIINE